MKWTWISTRPTTVEELTRVLNPRMKALENALAQQRDDAATTARHILLMGA